MNVRFQVFVSSTQRDLKSERERVINELNRVGYIAVGMEQFPATDEEQFEYIQRIIDESDYYVVIVKGRYGSEDASGVSFTEKEFDYAVATKKPALAFLYARPEKLTLEETDNDPEKLGKVLNFRAKLEAKRIVHYWENQIELVSSIKDSLNDVTRRRPGVGWVRGNQAADPSLYKELEALRRENEDLRRQVGDTEMDEVSFQSHLSHGDDKFEFAISIKKQGGTRDTYGREVFREVHRTKIPLSWNVLFYLLIPIVYDEPTQHQILEHLEYAIGDIIRLADDQRLEIMPGVITTIGHQYEALGLIRITSATGKFAALRHWEITEKGRRLIAQLKAIRKERKHSSLMSIDDVPSPDTNADNDPALVSG